MKTPLTGIYYHPSLRERQGSPYPAENINTSASHYPTENTEIYPTEPEQFPTDKPPQYPTPNAKTNIFNSIQRRKARNKNNRNSYSGGERRNSVSSMSENSDTTYPESESTLNIDPRLLIDRGKYTHV